MNAMTGKTVLITGATSGIGEATAYALAGMGFRVFVHGRTPAKAAAVVAAIKTKTGNPAVEFVGADFAQLSAVRAMAAEMLSRTARLDVLVNNAGAMHKKRSETADGFELTFAANHLAPFLLTNLLLDRIKSSSPARIVNVSSFGHRFSRLDFDDLQNTRRYSSLGVYGQSKLANLLFSRALDKRLKGTGVTTNALHPGGVRSGLGRNNNGAVDKLLLALLGPLMISAEAGAKTSVYLASSPDVAGVSGAYFANCKRVTPSAAARDDAAAERLWTVSAQMVGLA